MISQLKGAAILYNTVYTLYISIVRAKINETFVQMMLNGHALE